MGRKKRQSMPPPAPAAPPEPRVPGIVRMLVALPRLTRIVLTLLFSLSAALLFTFMVDYSLFLHFVLNTSVPFLPLLVACIAAVAMYILGYRYLVGTVGETPAPTMAVLWYFGIGATMVFFLLLMVLQGILTGTAPT